MTSKLTPEENEARAMGRHAILTLLRITGALLVMFGIIIYSKRLDFIPDSSAVVLGLLCIAAGLVEMFWIPITLAHRWRTPDA